MGIPNFAPVERVREAAIAIIAANLESELAAATTQAGNDLEIPPVADYLRTPASETTGQILVEVITLRARPNAAGAPMEWGQGRVTTDVSWEARAVAVNDGRWDDAQFLKVLDRIAAAMMAIIVVRNNRLGYNDGTILSTAAVGEWVYTVDTQRDPSGKRVRGINVPFVSKVQETVS